MRMRSVYGGPTEKKTFYVLWMKTFNKGFHKYALGNVYCAVI